MKALTLRKAAQEIGVSHATLRRWIHDGEGPRTFIKPGLPRSIYRIQRRDLELYIQQRSKGGRDHRPLRPGKSPGREEVDDDDEILLFALT
jgi:excisionase family DNA binding protein